jgi:penicillin-binding protein 1C
MGERRVFRKFVAGWGLRIAIAVTGCVILGAGALAFFAMREPAPQVLPFEKVRQAYEKSDGLLLDRHGVPIHELRTDFEGRKLDWIALGEISPALVKAVIHSEDRRFFKHGGADVRALCGAFTRNLLNGEKRGASTITMQLAAVINKSLRPRSGRRTVTQKWRQVRAAWEIERTWSKQEILEAYLNLVTFRGEVQGIAAASRGLFRKEPSGLNENESFVLAVLIRSPNASAERAVRRAQLLAASLKSRVSAPEMEGFVTATLTTPYYLKPRIALAPHVALYLLKPGMKHAMATLDGNLQALAEGLLKQYLTDLRDQNVKDAAALVLANKTGEVLAYVGNAGLNPHASHVDGIRAKRQAGSTLKPFLYAMAIDRRLITAATLLEDTPMDLPTDTGIYKPENYDNRYRGQVPARVALASSLNVPAVRVLLLTGREPFVQKLEALGFGPLRDGDYYGDSLALGTVDVSLWELTNACRTLANGGWWSEATLVPGVEKNTGRCVFSREAAFIVSDMLSDREARSTTFGLENPLSTAFWTASKTGTSKDMRDNWCIGFSSDYTVGVWVGNFSGEAMWNVSGISGAAPVWLEIMRYLHKTDPSRAPSPPDGVVLAAISNTDLNSRGDRGGSEELTQAYSDVRRGERRSDNEDIHLKANWYSSDRGTGKDWFIRGTEPGMVQSVKAWPLPRITYPPAGAMISLDPDIPTPHQKIFFQASSSPVRIRWLLDGELVGENTMQPWVPVGGHHWLSLLGADDRAIDTVNFTVRD